MNGRKPFFIVVLQALINFLFTIFELLLLGRIVLIFFNANQDNDFVRWVYEWSYPIVAPFDGIFGSISILGTFTLDIDALLAWFVYLILYVLAMEFLKFVSSLVVNSRLQ